MLFQSEIMKSIQQNVGGRLHNTVNDEVLTFSYERYNEDIHRFVHYYISTTLL